jgi:outer membrane protein OmpA-like peptidoglycan-associated protein
MLSGLLLAALLPGCATKKYTRAQVATSEERLGERLDGVDTTIEENQDLIMDQGRRLDEQEAMLTETSKTAQEALDRAIAAGKLAQGRLVYERVLSDDQVRFSVNGADLGDSAQAALDSFANELLGRNSGVFIEIQGHTDSTGSESHNMTLGQRRAESVRLYLNRAHGFPLHRTSVISYGESEPIADNSTNEGRARNRRVTLVVLE